MVNHPLHRLFVPLFYPFTYHSLIWLNNSLSELSKNGLGAEIKLTKDTKYICPSDGYFEIDCAYDTNSYALGYVEGKRVMSVASNNSGAVLATFPFSSIFVK